MRTSNSRVTYNRVIVVCQLINQFMFGVAQMMWN